MDEEDIQIQKAQLARTAPTTRVDVLVIGAGQAGLATGYRLAQEGVSFLIVDESQRVGDSWRNRYDSLALFTPRSLNALPGKGLDGDPDGYPSRDEFADYLANYALHYNLPVQTNFRVTSLDIEAETLFRAKGADGSVILARGVVVATGGFQVPVIPEIAKTFSSQVRQLTPETYKGPADVEHGPVVVIGDGASGRDIAFELSAFKSVILSRGRNRRLLPEKLLGISTWKWLKALGLLRVGPNSLLGRIMRKSDPFPNRERSDRDLKKRGVVLASRLIGADGKHAVFADGSALDVGAVIWCIGYRDDFTWLMIKAAKDQTGSIVVNDGRSPVPGLFFIGRPWQRNRASALVTGSAEDAQRLVDDLEQYLSNTRQGEGSIALVAE
ncbi:flavin-containing monooxygenase [Pelagibacterium lentulum]|uniref:flavin-containing monooxygenase n=1 Tax=Pelagibacterium lentulum TaxID=2029865 RepID=UPI000F8E9386|nr:NAD(P)/FAD-dependent oxidoreductase [Pelagibacterium lentulum]